MNLASRKFVEIEFLDEWMCHPAGSRATILETKVKELVSRGVAKIVEVKTKQIDEPPQHKMIVSAPIQKDVGAPVKRAGRPKKK